MVNRGAIAPAAKARIAMFNANTPEELWLLITNVVLMILVIITFTVICAGIIAQLFGAKSVARADAHAFRVPGLGMTMADGGEDVKDAEKKD